MNFNIGKVVKYTNKEGNILTKDGEKYLFLESDLNTVINKGDIVIFRGEKIYNKNRAFFVKNMKIYLKNEKNKSKMKKYIKKIDVVSKND